MESNVLTSIPGIQYYPIVSLLMFFALFAALLVWFFRADRARLAELAWAPFEDGPAQDKPSNIHHQN